MKINPDSFVREDDEPLDIRMDNIFKAVFARNTPESSAALSGLVSAVIGRNVAVVSILANEPPAGNVRDRQIRFDINCRAEDGELIDVEMCLNPDAFEPVRLEFYAAKLFCGQDIKGADKGYNDLKQAYQIAILAEKKFFADGSFLHAFEYYDPARRVPLGGRTQIITLELSKLDEIIEKPVGEMSMPEKWAVFFEYLTDKEKRVKINELLKQEEGIAMANEVLMTISRDEHERARLLSEYKYEVDMQSKLVTAKRERDQEILKLVNQEGFSMEELKQYLAKT